MRNIQQHAEAAVGLVVQQRIGKRFVVQSMDGEQLRVVVVAEVERAVFTQFETGSSTAARNSTPLMLEWETK